MADYGPTMAELEGAGCFYPPPPGHHRLRQSPTATPGG